MSGASATRPIFFCSDRLAQAAGAAPRISNPVEVTQQGVFVGSIPTPVFHGVRLKISPIELQSTSCVP